jgi:hypothetical protein
MPYIINKYDGTELAVLEDGSINTSTSLGLIGRNYFGYGEQQNENFVFLLENFANVNPPVRPINGQTWFDTNENLLKVYNGTAWTVVGSAVVSETAPTTATVGSLWLKIPSNVLYAYNGNTWSFIGPETVEGFGVTRAESTSLLDSTNVQRPVILFKANGKVTAIASSIAFTLNPGTPIDGFANITEGVTVSSLMKFKGALEGLAERATRLQTTRLINGVGFNGTTDITLKAATTNRLTPGRFINGDLFDGSSPETWSVNATPDNEGDKIVARNTSGDFSARNITANLIGDVQGNITASNGTSYFNICYANKFEGAILTGNAETASRLQTPRKLNGVLFSGVEDIEIPANAETLSGTFIKSSIVGSNLQQVGTLQSLSIQSAGINVGTESQKIRIGIPGAGAAIYSETGTLRIGTNANPEFNFLDAATSQAQGGPAGFSTLSPIGNSNIGLPSKKVKTIYADQLEGNSATSTLAASAVHLSGGSPGSIPYQSSAGVTQYLPAGTAGYVLKASVNNGLVWGPLGNEKLNKGAYLNFVDAGLNPVNFYDVQNPVTISVNATSSAIVNSVVARDANGDFSTRQITLSQPPTAANHAVTKEYVDAEKYIITYGNTVYSTSGFTNGSWSNAANYFDVFPPTGKTMNDLVAFVPSIAVIHFSGRVNDDDSLRCIWTNLGDRVRVYVQNTEQRSTPAANYLAIWS